MIKWQSTNGRKLIGTNDVDDRGSHFVLLYKNASSSSSEIMTCAKSVFIYKLQNSTCACLSKNYLATQKCQRPQNDVIPKFRTYVHHKIISKCLQKTQPRGLLERCATQAHPIVLHKMMLPVVRRREIPRNKNLLPRRVNFV